MIGPQKLKFLITFLGGGGGGVLLVFMVLFGSFFLVSSVDLVGIYLFFELQTIILFILVAKRNSAYGTEAGLKYLVLGVDSSGLFLFSGALLYVVSGDRSVQVINSVLMGDVGKTFMTISFLFKLFASSSYVGLKCV